MRHKSHKPAQSTTTVSDVILTFLDVSTWQEVV